MDAIPEKLRGVFFHDPAGQWLRWHTGKLWALPTASTQVDAAELWWHLELPVWPTAPPARIFDLSPAEVLAAPERYPSHWQRTLEADLSFPLELFENFGRWVILDGYHRLARHFLERAERISVRRHERSLLSTILKPR